MPENKAAWLDGKGEQLRIAEAPMPEPEADSIVIQNKALVINPVDWKIQDSGMFVQKWPMILGCDVAGEVVEVGSSVKKFKRGDRVAAHTISLASSRVEDGAFQLYSSAKADKAAIIPANVSFKEGAVLPLAFDTASVGLYGSKENGLLELELPSLEPSPSDQTIFVYGGSSSVGALAIQLAVASGAKVVTTASRHNYDFCKKCGASEVIDYRSPSVVDDVVSAIKNSEALLRELGLPITEKLGGGSYAYVLMAPADPPESVKPGQVYSISELTHQLWNDYVTKALESGVVKCLPDPLVIGRGLESIQKGLDENKKGVSARKVVIEL